MFSSLKNVNVVVVVGVVVVVVYSALSLFFICSGVADSFPSLNVFDYTARFVFI